MSRFTSSLRSRITPRMARDVSRRAREELCSPSEIVRRALDAYLAKPAQPPAGARRDG